jgi:hypothetical protein
MKNYYLLPKKEVSEKKLIEKLDRIFSLFIRLRDSNLSGICVCITCGKPVFFKDCDAGHFIQRDRKATRYNTQNVHAQCKYCNRYRSGNQYEHGKKIDLLYGKDTAEKLKILGQARGTKLSTDWLMHHIDIYKKKVDILMKEKILLI